MARKIYITESDLERLKKTVGDLLQAAPDEKEHLRDLNGELDRAVIVTDGDLPRDVITMHSKVTLLMDGTEKETVTLVYPSEIDLEKNKISVLSPIGTAILGYREGDVIQWEVPTGATEIIVDTVLFQPESSVRENADEAGQ
jgi:regulator of nucleoside diphosphate kinase